MCTCINYSILILCMPFFYFPAMATKILGVEVTGTKVNEVVRKMNQEAKRRKGGQSGDNVDSVEENEEDDEECENNEDLEEL